MREVFNNNCFPKFLSGSVLKPPKKNDMLSEFILSNFPHGVSFLVLNKQ
jgi:hypothetical protein